MRRRISGRIGVLAVVPFFRRLGFHVRRLTGGVDHSFFVRLFGALAAIVLTASVLVALSEGPRDDVGGFFRKVGTSIYWAVTTVMGSGDASYVTTPGGFIISWLLVLFGVAIVGVITAALVGFVIDFILKEGQGMGASGYRDHIVVCGWNSTARELIAELSTDEYTTKVVVVHDSDKNPAGSGVYFVNGDITNADDLRRAGIEEAMAAIVCPADASNGADMRSILTCMAIGAIAPTVRTVVEVNNPEHVDHFLRANADEVVVTSRIASRLLARSSLYPGLAQLVTDIVSGGEGSELYRVEIPDECIGLTLDELSARLRSDHSATLLGVNRDGVAFVNPPSDFRLERGDDAVVVAESLGTLAPLRMSHDD
ncbi:potassium channel family protein [Aeromicrobium terrae]|uniref:TrkA family potassium uptake protein n=1 Tax=Aeromicrobium terrae TaxID=2498846 RepID=A0A5C8NHB1_9ACTN|nr:NAD-binding protein [Aeromicrobium terrae]TXL60668.1 TrkA family potassium uptake protein [Aeromicrobium terrae]